MEQLIILIILASMLNSSTAEYRFTSPGESVEVHQNKENGNISEGETAYSPFAHLLTLGMRYDEVTGILDDNDLFYSKYEVNSTHDDWMYGYAVLELEGLDLSFDRDGILRSIWISDYRETCYGDYIGKSIDEITPRFAESPVKYDFDIPDTALYEFKEDEYFISFKTDENIVTAYKISTYDFNGMSGEENKSGVSVSKDYNHIVDFLSLGTSYYDAIYILDDNGVEYSLYECRLTPENWKFGYTVIELDWCSLFYDGKNILCSIEFYDNRGVRYGELVGRHISDVANAFTNEPVVYDLDTLESAIYEFENNDVFIICSVDRSIVTKYEVSLYNYKGQK